jgi:hypothetical protein
VNTASPTELAACPAHSRARARLTSERPTSGPRRLLTPGAHAAPGAARPVVGSDRGAIHLELAAAATADFSRPARPAW